MHDEISDMLNDLSRRDFLRIGSLTAVGASISSLHAEPSKTHASSMFGVPYAAVDPKVGIIGTGGRGTSLLGNLLAADVKVLAICDVVKEKAEHAQSLVEKSGQRPPELYRSEEHTSELQSLRHLAC